MKTVNKLLALLLTLALLVSVPVVAFAEETVADLFPAKENILNSITTEEKTGNGLAFLFEMNVRGATANPNHVADYTNAKATVDGVEYSVVGMGAVMANQAADIAVIDTLTRENANDGKTILDVPAVYLYDIAEDGNSCTFAVRIVRVPEMAQGNAIGARPYVVLKNGDEEITLYGNSDMPPITRCTMPTMKKRPPFWISPSWATWTTRSPFPLLPCTRLFAPPPTKRASWSL